MSWPFQIQSINTISCLCTFIMCFFDKLVMKQFQYLMFFLRLNLWNCFESIKFLLGIFRKKYILNLKTVLLLNRRALNYAVETVFVHLFYVHETDISVKMGFSVQKHGNIQNIKKKESEKKRAKLRCTKNKPYKLQSKTSKTEAPIKGCQRKLYIKNNLQNVLH